MNDVDEVLTEQQAATFLKFSRRKVFSLRVDGKLPHKQIGGQVRYLKSNLLRWLNGEDVNGK